MIYVTGPQGQPICDLCGFTCYVHRAGDGTIVATHPTGTKCTDNGKAFKCPKFECTPLPDEYAYPNV